MVADWLCMKNISDPEYLFTMNCICDISMVDRLKWWQQLCLRCSKFVFTLSENAHTFAILTKDKELSKWLHLNTESQVNDKTLDFIKRMGNLELLEFYQKLVKQNNN